MNRERAALQEALDLPDHEVAGLGARVARGERGVGPRARFRIGLSIPLAIGLSLAVAWFAAPCTPRPFTVAGQPPRFWRDESGVYGAVILFPIGSEGTVTVPGSSLAKRRPGDRARLRTVLIRELDAARSVAPFWPDDYPRPAFPDGVKSRLYLNVGGPLSGGTTILIPGDGPNAEAIWQRERVGRVDDLLDQAEDTARERERTAPAP